jgi:hypothetical protein
MRLSGTALPMGADPDATAGTALPGAELFIGAPQWLQYGSLSADNWPQDSQITGAPLKRKFAPQKMQRYYRESNRLLEQSWDMILRRAAVVQPPVQGLFLLAIKDYQRSARQSSDVSVVDGITPGAVLPHWQ